MMAPDAPCELNIELSMMRMWGDVHDGKWLSCMAGDAMMWPAASSKITAPKLRRHQSPLEQCAGSTHQSTSTSRGAQSMVKLAACGSTEPVMRFMQASRNRRHEGGSPRMTFSRSEENT